MRNSFALFFLFILAPCFGQIYVNPFLNNINRFNHQDIVIVWDEPGTTNVDQQLFGFDWIGEAAGQPDLVQSNTNATAMDEIELDGGRYINAHAGKFNDDAADDIFHLIGTADGFRCGIGGVSSVLQPDTTYQNDLISPAAYVDIMTAATHGYPRTAIGDLDGDGTMEVAVAWWEPTGDLVHIQLLDADNSLDLQLRASIADQASVRINNYHAYDISIGDLNGDGAEEVILIGLEPSSSGDALFQVFMKVYEVNSTGSNTITPKAYAVIDDQHLANDNGEGYQLGYAQTAIAGRRLAADTLSDPTHDIFAAFAFTYWDPDVINYDNFFQFLISASADLNTLTIENSATAQLSNFRPEYPVEIGASDINGDLIEDVVIATTTFHLFAIENNAIVSKGQLGGIQLDENNSGIRESVDRIEFGDVDQDGRNEFIAFSKSFDGEDQHTFTISVNGVDSVFDPEGGGSYSFNEEYSNAQRSYGLAVGNLDGRDMHFGEPTVVQCEYVQPLFIIGAVPNHFDVINGTQYDVNNCYPVQDCDQVVSISQTGSSSSETEVEITSDWAVANSFELGFEAYGVDIGGSLEHKYGEKFSQVNTELNSQSITLTITASADDMVQYAKIPVTLYEYPVMTAIGDTVQWIAALFPTNNVSPQNIVANGKSLFNFLPDHEPGNILSYPTISPNYLGISDLPGTTGDWIILDAQNVPNYTVSPSGSISYELQAGSQLDWASSGTSHSSTELGISAKGYGLGASTKGTYESSQMNLFKHSVSESTRFTIEPTNIIGSPNEFNYVIAPKIYWNRDGSGVVSFEVDIDAQPGSGSFWSQAYTTLPDPSLNMPYQHELLLNPDLSNTENLDRTKSMRFSTNVPNPGDTVVVSLRMYNYSLAGTGQPVQVMLYHGHPDDGGTLLADVDGNTIIQTSGALPPRGREEIEIAFISTSEMIAEDFLKIYAVLDPNDQINEIHEDNNLGWAQLGYPCNAPETPVGLPEMAVSVGEHERLSIHPVPATVQVIIDHDMRGSRSEHAFILIRNMIGEEVARFSVSNVFAGQIFWNTRAIPAGMYAIGLYDDHGLRNSGKAIITH